MYKRSMLFGALALAALQVQAVPAKPVKRVANLEGCSVELTLKGDEALHYWVDAKGRTFQLDEKQEARSFDVNEAYRRLEALNIPQDETNWKRPELTLQKAAEKPAQKADTLGAEVRRGLVILVQTPDVQFTCAEKPDSLISAMMNEPGFSHGKADGSVADYFFDQSYGQLEYRFDVVGPVTVSHEMSYYGSNTRFSEGQQFAAGELVYEAVKLADDLVDFSVYPRNKTGEVDNIYILYAGYSEAQGAPDWTIWPHSYKLSNVHYYNTPVNRVRCDGVYVNNYACSAEYRDAAGGVLDGVGTFCHEFSHCLGLMDTYNTIETDRYTNGFWDLMSVGCYNNDSDTPPSYTAYERWQCGWLEPEVLTGDTLITDLENIDLNGRCFVCFNDKYRDEYYLFQTVVNEGWNTYLTGDGMAIWHIDYDMAAWFRNEINNDNNHLRCALVCADGVRSYKTEMGDLYPYNGLDSLTVNSNPKNSFFHRNSSGHYVMNGDITEIAWSGEGLMSFRYTVRPVIDALNPVRLEEAMGEPQEPCTNLMGQRVDTGYRGIVVDASGRKFLRK